MSSIRAPKKFLTLTFLSLFENLLSSVPDNIESPTIKVVFLSYLWRFSFDLGDTWDFLVFVNFCCCFLRNSMSWFSIVIIDPSPITWCCYNSSFRCSSCCVWFCGIFLYVLFLHCSLAVALIWIGWVLVCLGIFSPDSFEFVCMQFMIFNKLSIVLCFWSSSFLKKGFLHKKIYRQYIYYYCAYLNYLFNKAEAYLL